jgi:hypothetical protein
LRPVSRQRLWNAFIGSAQPRPLDIELRIALIGADQRLRQFLGTSPRTGQNADSDGQRGRGA